MSSEVEIKAAFLYQISQFTRWSVDASSPAIPVLTICVANNPSIFSALKPLEKRERLERKIHIMPLSADTARQCDIAYLEKAVPTELQESVFRQHRPGMLTVSSEHGFARKGGMIELAHRDGKIHMLINRQSAESAGISFSAKLLEASTLVQATSAGDKQ